MSSIRPCTGSNKQEKISFIPGISDRDLVIGLIATAIIFGIVLSSKGLSECLNLFSKFLQGSSKIVIGATIVVVFAIMLRILQVEEHNKPIRIRENLDRLKSIARDSKRGDSLISEEQRPRGAGNPTTPVYQTEGESSLPPLVQREEPPDRLNSSL